MFLSVTDWDGHELTVEMQKPLALANELVDRLEEFQLARAAELAQNPNPNTNPQA
ncbi:hypothetical protein ACWIB8_08345 [Corynebacterium flavescens]